ncbi:MAG: adenosylcobinamide-GDP ribazoletransferase [Actinomycetota bacterium]|nr:adenosylcobinamide-GDP ribazoletransferase [Actinomycetota bacterium]
MKGFMNALGFLTIIKIPGKYIQSKKEISGSLILFPLVGLFIGIVMSIFYFSLSLILPIVMSIVFLIILQVIITGGAHIDGLCDMSDGVFSGRSDKKKILEIMKKSDIGVFGVLTIVFLLLLKILFIYYLARINTIHFLFFYLVILFMPAFGRWSMVYMISRYNNVRGSSSLASIFTDKKNNRKEAYLSSIYLSLLFLGAYIIVGYFFTDWTQAVFPGGIVGNFSGIFTIIYFLMKSLSVMVIFMLLLLFVGWFFTRRIGGITGDIIGGTSEIMEVLFLFINYIIFSFL